MIKSAFNGDFKLEVVHYVLKHPDESKLSVAKRFGIADNTVHRWLKGAGNNNQEIHSRASNNFSSDKAKEIRDIYENHTESMVLSK